MKLMDEIAFVFKRFGDEQSTLLDQFERLTFEVQLNQAILGRSLSEPGAGGSRFKPPLNGEVPPALVKSQVTQGRRRGGGFNKVLKKLLKPMFGKNNGAKGGCHCKASAAADNDDDGGVKRVVPDPKNPKTWKALSRSLRF